MGSRTPVFSRRDIYRRNNQLKISPMLVRIVLSIAVSVVIHQRYIAVSVVIHQRSIAVSVVIHQRLSIQRKVQCDDIGDELVRYSNGFKSWCARLYKIYMKIPVYNICKFPFLTIDPLMCLSYEAYTCLICVGSMDSNHS